MDLDVDEKPQKTNARNKIARRIFNHHFFRQRKNEKDKTQPSPINKAISLMSPNFEPSREKSKLTNSFL